MSRVFVTYPPRENFKDGKYFMAEAGKVQSDKFLEWRLLKAAYLMFFISFESCMNEFWEPDILSDEEFKLLYFGKRDWDFISIHEKWEKYFLVTAAELDQSETFWTNFIDFKNFRNEIIHLKPGKDGRYYFKLETNIQNFYECTKDMLSRYRNKPEIDEWDNS